VPGGTEGGRGKRGEREAGARRRGGEDRLVPWSLRASEDPAVERGMMRWAARKRGILLFAPIYMGTIRFALVYIGLSFLTHFTLPINNLPLVRSSPRLKTETPLYL
jgi:hypothetical protein